MKFSDYIGKAYASGGRGPDSFDCWGLVMSVFAVRYEILLDSQPTLPEDMSGVVKAFTTGKESDTWRSVTVLEEGVVAACGRNRYITHAGICIGEGLIMHTTKEAGQVVIQSMQQIKRAYPLIEFYKHKDLP